MRYSHFGHMFACYIGGEKRIREREGERERERGRERGREGWVRGGLFSHSIVVCVKP